ncbi:MAG: type II secretion system protein GspK, partial [Proteobacteria bacterium]|nr:type II secretion system protein GspK [Pseudomonadota bacterium]
ALGLADAVLDWRDGDHDTRAEGSEDSDYRLAGLPHGAKDAPFESIYELLLVKGVTADLFMRVRDHITVHSRVRTIDPKAATVLALAAVPGFEQQSAQEYVELRDRSSSCTALPPPPPSPGASAYLGPSPGISYTVVATAAVDGARFQREAILGLTFRRDEPYRILGWSVRAPDVPVANDPAPTGDSAGDG